MATQPIIDKNTAGKIVSLCDWVYHLGVDEAYYKSDYGLAMEFLDKTSKQGIYGLLGKEIYFDWFEWQLQLIRAARESKSAFPCIMEYLKKMGDWQTNWLSVFIPISFDFYRKGIADQINNPNGCDMAIFHDRKRVWWSKFGVQNVSNREYVSLIQQMCLDRRRMDIAEMEAYEDKRETKYQRIGEWDMRKRVLNPRYYERFIQAISIYTAKKE